MGLPTLDFSPFFREIERQIKSLGRSARSYHTDPQVIGEIARDINLSVSELYSLAAKEAGRPGGLLDKRLSSIGLRSEKLAKSHPEVLRDLQRVCGRCTSSVTCANDFARADGSAGIPPYCPNEQTLQAILQEEGNAAATAANCAAEQESVRCWRSCCSRCLE
jgi:hypothetical protein